MDYYAKCWFVTDHYDLLSGLSQLYYSKSIDYNIEPKRRAKTVKLMWLLR